MFNSLAFALNSNVIAINIQYFLISILFIIIFLMGFWGFGVLGFWTIITTINRKQTIVIKTKKIENVLIWLIIILL